MPTVQSQYPILTARPSFLTEREFISLWDMVTKLPVMQFYWLSHELIRVADAHGDVVGWNAEVAAIYDFAIPLCELIGLDTTAMAPLYNVRAALQRYDLTGNYGDDDIRLKLKAFQKNLEIELGKRGFAYIPEEKTEYLGQEKPLGEGVYGAFPSARFDLTEASDCLACGLNTAAGFHLMRVIEVGLWELGRDRQIPSKDKIEFMEWGRIIGEIEDEVHKISQWPNSPLKEDAHKFYNRALQEIRGFNDGWRRHLAHLRATQSALNDSEVFALYGHVERFLKGLAEKIAEGRYTPLQWV